MARMRLNITTAIGSALAVLMLVLAGCGGGSMVGRNYDDFSAYFNTFYNAKQAFEEGRQAMEAEVGAIDRSVYLPLFPTSEQARSRQQFQEVVSKSADVLREHPNSRWVDDALLLIGKSYFYLNNYVGAEQKFREAIGLGTGQADEARFWLARTLIASGSHAEAVQHLQESLLRDDLVPAWKARLQLALGTVYLKEENWEDAAQSIQEGIGGIRDGRLQARAYFLLGQIYETMGRYEESIAAFEEVQNRRPYYELGYAAQVSGIRIEGMYGDAKAALDALDRMQRDDKHFEHSAEMAYLRGRIYQSQGRSSEAASLFQSLLYDPDRSSREIVPYLHHALGEIYRDAYSDYVTAAAHFDTAATELHRVGMRDVSGRQSTSEALIGVQERANRFGTFAEVRSQISRMDSLLHLGSLDEGAFNEVVLQMRQAKARKLAARRQQREADEIQSAFSAEQAERQGGQQNAAQSGGEAGFLFHRDPIRVQEGHEEFVMQWGDRPLAENWRRIAALSAVTAENGEGAGGGGGQLEGLETVEGIGQLPPVDVSDVPRDSLSRAEMQIGRARARYELGNVLFLLMNQPDSAAVWYRRVIEEDAEQAVAARAYYALAEVRRSQGDMAAARRLYEEVLLRDTDGNLAARVRARLGQQAAAPEPADSLAQARSAYGRAYGAWRQQQYERALSDMLILARQYDTTPVAPKALLAAGSIYLEWVRQDGLDLSAGIPFSFDDSLAGAPAAPDALPDSIDRSAPMPDTVVTGSQSQVPALLADASAGVERTPLARLYTIITERYPESPQAGRAQNMLAALEERGLVPRLKADSVATQASEQPAAGTAADTLQQERQAVPSSSAEDAPFGLEGREVDEQLGGYTWVVASHPEPGPAHRMVAALQQSGYKAKVVTRTIEEQRHHDVIVGQFPSRRDAMATRDELPQGTSDDAEVVAIPKN